VSAEVPTEKSAHACKQLCMFGYIMLAPIAPVQFAWMVVQ